MVDFKKIFFHFVHFHSQRKNIININFRWNNVVLFIWVIYFISIFSINFFLFSIPFPNWCFIRLMSSMTLLILLSVDSSCESFCSVFYFNFYSFCYFILRFCSFPFFFSFFIFLRFFLCSFAIALVFLWWLRGSRVPDSVWFCVAEFLRLPLCMLT